MTLAQGLAAVAVALVLATCVAAGYARNVERDRRRRVRKVTT